MAELTFRDLSFEDSGDAVIVRLLRSFFFTIPKKELQKIGGFTIAREKLVFPAVSEKAAGNKLNRIIAAHIAELRNITNNKPAVYIHQASGIPLFGSRAFGIVDKGSSLLEIKPLTSCNIGCTFCSVDEGIASRKVFSYVIEEEYLIKELEKLMVYKGHPDMHVYINPHGEPMLYARIVELVRDMRQIGGIRKVSIITNGSLLSEKMIDELVAAGLTHLNVSLNAFDAAEAKQLAGTPVYDVGRVKNAVEYAVRNHTGALQTIIAPVWIDGQNDAQIEKLVQYGKKLGVPVQIQKFCINKHGRNPADEIGWDEFFAKLEQLEQKFDVKLREGLSTLAETKELPKPFQKGQTVKARIVCKGRNPRERYAVAGGKEGAVPEFGISGERLICVQDCTAEDGTILKVRITKDAHTVFYGEEG